MLTGDLEKIREEHNEITYEMIITSISPNNHYLSLGLIPDPDLVESVATVAAGHRKRDLTASEYTPFIFEDGIIRPQLLATLLRIGDGLDIDHRRVKMENLKLAQISALSRFHWYKCYYISGVWVLDEFIHIGYRFPPDSEYENLISPLVENNIRDELANFEAFLRSHNAKLSIAESTFRLIPTIEEMPEDVIDFAKQELQKQTERKKNIQSPSLPVDDLTKEVTQWIKAMGYEVINRDRVGNWCINLFVVNESGLLPHKAIIACLDGEINVNRIQSLEPIINKHNVQQCWIICDKRIAQSARDYVSDNQTIQVFTLAEFLNEIFGHYFNYITGIVEDSDIKQYYINLRCKKPIINSVEEIPDHDILHSVDDYIDLWLNEWGKTHISLLGEFGTGKTWFCKYYAYRQIKKFMLNPADERLPILITLRDYTQTGNIEQVITDLIINRHKIKLTGSYNDFDKLNRQEKFLIILDGFDEMANQVDHNITVKHFDDIAQLAVPGSKVLLTCRTPYFRTYMEERNLLVSKEQKDLVIGRPDFEILYLQDFTIDQIEEVLKKRVPNDWENYLKTIQTIYDLPNLAKRPIMLDMIVSALPDLEEMDIINHSMLYKTYTNQWIDKEIIEERTLQSASDKVYFSQEVAWEMFKTEELSINFERIRNLLEKYLEPKLKNPNDLLYLENDIRTASFISKRDDLGNYEFIHRSFMEFFVAQKMANAIAQEDTELLGEQAVYYEIIRFINQMIDIEKDVPTIIKMWGNPQNNETLRANCIRISGQWVDSEVLSKLMLLVESNNEPSSLRRDAIRSIVRILNGEEKDWVGKHIRKTLQGFAIRTSRDNLQVECLPIDIKLLNEDSFSTERMDLRRDYSNKVSSLLAKYLFEDVKEEIRINASYALIYFIDESLVPEILKIAKSDHNQYVRFNCCTSLIALNHPNTRKLIKNIISTTDDQSIITLGEMNLAAINQSQT